MYGDDIPYVLTFEVRPGYLFANGAADTIDRQSALSYLREVGAKCSTIGSRKLRSQVNSGR